MVDINMQQMLKVIPFNKVDKQHAYLDGEGDLSLVYWR